MVKNEDIITLLPDNLLHHILSFLPTKDAVSTCLLSKRWQYLWMSTTNLEFYHGKGKKRKKKFTRFVKQVLRFHSSSISRFSLSMRHCISPNRRINSWISAAVQRHVQELHLLLCLGRLQLPDTLCTSNVLTVLEICSAELNLPSVIRFSSLKNLTLQCVRFPDDDSFLRFFSGLPVVESLKLEHCVWFNSRTATIISIRTLKSLTIEYLLCRHGNSEIKFDIENLGYLKYSTDLCIDLVLPDMPVLTHASIIMIRNRTSATTGALRAAKLFNSLRFAKSLKVDGTSLEWLDDRNSPEKINIFAEFVNLTALEVDPGVTNKPAGRVLMGIFRSSPLLESFALRKLYYGKWNRKKSCPECVEFRLKECSLLSFTGCLPDIAFVRFFLKNAKALEQIKLYCTKDLWNQREKLEKVIEKLEELPRISNDCVIEYLKS